MKIILARLTRTSDMNDFLCSILIFFLISISSSFAADTLNVKQTLRDDGNCTIVSSGGEFELGFFSPGSSKNRYLGIWYKKVSNRTVVWVANRDTPILDTSGVLRIDASGNLELVNARNSTIWFSNSTKAAVNNPVMAQLMESSNLVIRYVNDSDPENYLWQSVDHPTDHILSGMKLGWDLSKGLDRYLTSWKSMNDPSPGNYTFRMYLEGYPQMKVADGSTIDFRFGPWDGIQFSGVQFKAPDLNFDLKLIVVDNEIYAKFDVNNNTRPVRFVLNPDGIIRLLTWYDQAKNWTFSQYIRVIFDECDPYGLCGTFGSCDITRAQSGRSACECLGGFVPKFPEKWKLSDWSGGCVRAAQLTCSSEDRFEKIPNLKLPDTQTAWFNRSMSLADCETECRKNCSCTAYSNVDIRQGGTGCMLWFGDLIDMRNYPDNGLPLHIRSSSQLGVNGSLNKKGKVKMISIVIPAAVGVLVLLVLILIYVFRNRKLKSKGLLTLKPDKDGGKKDEGEDLELPLIDFELIAKATNKFSVNNKLGEGGFGPVYKGTLDDGQEIAVKRLSKTSKQGLDEFKNEVKCIAKLQHRNLVRLLGCCIEDGEMLLIYEYMPNKSLDVFIFDKELSVSLDWPKRYSIINGIAKGLLYLHQDSRLRIIHRDLKAGNILLDHEMSPRISDFGLARSFAGNESAVNTVRVVGTYGYMAPEYAIEGLFSVKSDSYSFGVLVLEIVSGKKIRQFYNSKDNLNLLGHAWKLFNDGEFLDLADEIMFGSCNLSEVLRAIHIGLLCVQPYPQDRPNMTYVVSMLDSENELPQPKQPGFFTESRGQQGSESPSHNTGSSLTNNALTITMLDPR
ncbi:G-type lectin S-receptor-like serine/threonine-protein kinase At4g27290 [Apium graveolens]|uniref:G-type lectin S-receptor-like serine/threonine-protein kinase At4g27290 n=1 Tax=Apium graveolens TaxID=4045 RepID=UPI003D793607